tara:strand:+ start:3726 stop:4526 length:801 start_codon:yes stop_codon:yes gene_type:complete
MKKKELHIIKKDTPRDIVKKSIATFIFIFLSVFLSYSIISESFLLSYEIGKDRISNLIKENDNYIDVIQKKDKEIIDLKKDVETAQKIHKKYKQAVLVDIISVDNLKKDLRAKDEKNKKLISELNFYKKITEEDNKRSFEIHVKGLEIKRIGDTENYDYNFLIYTLNSSGKTTKYKYSIELSGKDSDVSKTLHFSQISSNKKKSSNGKISYQEKIKGTLNIPKNFVPETVHLAINSKKSTINIDYEWKNIYITSNITSVNKQFSLY